MKSNTLSFNLHKHNDLIKKVLISPNGDLVLSGGCDKTVNLWDLRFHHKILKSWDFYENSIVDIKAVNGFSEFLSADLSGNLFYTDIMSHSYTVIDSINEPITSIEMTDKLGILCATSKNTLYDYVS